MAFPPGGGGESGVGMETNHRCRFNGIAQRSRARTRTRKFGAGRHTGGSSSYLKNTRAANGVYHY